MPLFHLRVYVGPTMVGAMAEKFRGAGIKVTLEGTAHVWCEVEADDVEYGAERKFLDMLRTAYGYTFCLGFRDVHAVRKQIPPVEA